MKANTKMKAFIMLLLLFPLYTALSAISYANQMSKEMQGSIFRLHVIGASDSVEDQELKLLVRDKILAYMNEISKEVTNKETILSLVEENLTSFQLIAQNTVYEKGYDYKTEATIGNFDFPTKTYGDISFPSGNYDGLKIELGEAEGQNWWCVLFPPLCFVDVSSGIVPLDSKEIMQESLSEEGFRIISENNSEIKFKFRLLELLQDSKILTAQN